MNQQFYIAVNGQQTGPFSLDDLRTKNVQRDTLIWTEGLDSWTKAEHVALLKDLLRATPPPLPNTETKTTSQQVPPPVVPPQPTGKYFGYDLATRIERFFAELVQTIIIGIPVTLILGPADLLPKDLWDMIIIGVLFGVILGFINLFFYPRWSGNIGHKVLGLKVISAEDGADYKFPLMGAAREFLKQLFGSVYLPNAWLLWDADRQNLYDKVVKTYVVKKKSER